jgi:hypothetical protein
MRPDEQRDDADRSPQPVDGARQSLRSAEAGHSRHAGVAAVFRVITGRRRRSGRDRQREAPDRRRRPQTGARRARGPPSEHAASVRRVRAGRPSVARALANLGRPPGPAKPRPLRAECASVNRGALRAISSYERPHRHALGSRTATSVHDARATVSSTIRTLMMRESRRCALRLPGLAKARREQAARLRGSPARPMRQGAQRRGFSSAAREAGPAPGLSSDAREAGARRSGLSSAP